MATVVDLVVIREALAAAAAGLGLEAHAYPPASPAVGPFGTFIVAEPDTVDLIVYHQTGDGGVLINLVGQVLVVNSVDGQRLLDRYRGTRHADSLTDALDAAINAGNAADYVIVTAFGPFSTIVYGESATYVGAEMRIEVYA